MYANIFTIPATPALKVDTMGIQSIIIFLHATVQIQRGNKGHSRTPPNQL